MFRVRYLSVPQPAGTVESVLHERTVDAVSFPGTVPSGVAHKAPHTRHKRQAASSEERT